MFYGNSQKSQILLLKGLTVLDGSRKYRFSEKEINYMVESINIHCKNEENEHSAWRLRLSLKMSAECTNCNKKERAKRYRLLALYNELTTKDDFLKEGYNSNLQR